jgi:two-component system sensor histidine kinase MprB
MSLRRRITAVTTLAVAAVAITLGAITYLSARSHLIGDTRTQLSQRASSFLHYDNGNGLGGGVGIGDGDNSGGRPRSDPYSNGEPPTPPFGGAPGDFQIVRPNGTVVKVGGSTSDLPVTAAVKATARADRGSFYRSVTVKGTHLEVLTFANPQDHTAVEVALPLTQVDSVLHAVLITYALVATAAALLAGLIGTLVAKAALSPINRFTERTEAVTGALHGPRRLDGGGTTGLQRLEGGGATELQRLAHSFNQTLDALEISMQAQRHLIADASHELRTPMAALRSNIQIFLEAEALPREERAELQQAILAELDELTQLVADVLDLARGASPSDHIESVELDTLVREAIGRARRRAPTVEFATELEPTVISNAPERVTRAIGNVIDNARKWSPPEGPIEVTLRDGVLRVRDHGPGFKQSDIEHVFDRFYRADEARRLPGSGLGLAIVRQAAEAYGGTVIATNAEDGGAVIEVAFGSRPAGGLLQNS